MHLARKVLNQVLSGMEVILAGFLIIIIAILAFKLAAGTFFGEALVPKSVSWYIEQVMNLAIGIEFAKMLFHHTPGTIIEVLLCDVVRENLKKHDLPAEVGMSFVLGDATLRIEEMHEGSIRKVELVKTRSLFNE